MSAPERLSVVMPVKNSGRFVAESLESIRAQTFGDFELIVVDDGSTDDSMDIIRSAAEERIRIVPGPQRGVAAALNRGLEAARGELVARIDADDVCEPDRFAVQADFLAYDTSIQVVGSDFLEIDASSGTIARFAAVDHPELSATSLLVENPLIHSSVMARLSVLKELGGYRETASEDYELWCRLVRAGGRLTNIPKTLVRWRWHEGAVTKSNAQGVRASARETCDAFRDGFVAAGAAPPEVRADGLCAEGGRAPLLARRVQWIYRRFGAFFFERGDYAKAQRAFSLARDNARLCAGARLDAPLRSSYPLRRFESAVKSLAMRCSPLARLLAAKGPWTYKPLER